MNDSRFHDAALAAVRSYYPLRNNCDLSKPYMRECVRAAIRDVRTARAITYTVIHRESGETRRLTRAQLDRWFENRSPLGWRVV